MNCPTFSYIKGLDDLSKKMDFFLLVGKIIKAWEFFVDFKEKFHSF